jgi:hypothetical protein
MGSGFNLYIILSALALSGCASEPILSPSELNAHADQYNGKRVKVHGWVVLRFEEYSIWDSKLAYDRPFNVSNMGACVSYLGPLGHETRGEMRTLTGTFWKDFGGSLDVIMLGACNFSGLDLDNRPRVLKKSN